ncbi:MAG: peptidoglycan-binding domain-containing protein [Blastocatellia bacterium]
MKKNALSCLSVAVALLLPILAVAQTPSTNNQAADPQTPEWRITEKEVIAVQAELTRRGFYKSKITGVLDRDTREAVRAFQSDNGMKASGRIDRATYEKLELTYPATGKEADSLRRNGLLPKIGYGVKDTATSAGGAATGAAKKVGSGVRTGVEKTWEAGGTTVSKSKEAVQGAPGVALKGAKSAGRGAERAGARLIGRSDAEIHEEVRRTLEDNPETKYWYSEVKNGMVTVKTPPQSKADIGAVVSNIRKVAGVKSVFVIAQ